MSTPESSSPDEANAPDVIQSALKCDKSKPTNGDYVSSPKIFLRPSALAAQTEKLKLMKPEEKCPKLQCAENARNTSDASALPKLVVENCNEMPKTVSTPLLFSSNKPTPFSNIFTASPSVTPSISTSALKNVQSESDKDSNQQGEGFVFGRNLHDRALNYDVSSKEEEEAATTTKCTLSFENAADLKEKAQKQPEKTLSDFAKEYEVKRQKVTFEEVEVITGEEGESNVLQLNCKLFAFDKTKMNWLEKGRGFLRLNDREDQGILHSRLIMRVQGSLKVILNTKVWSAMKLERPSLKTLQFTAVDSDEGVKVYLTMGNSNDIEQLYNALECRITNLRHQESVSSKNIATPDKTESVSVPLLDTSSNDSFESSPRKRFRPLHPEDGSADSSTENITTEGTYDASSENSTDSTDGVKTYEPEARKEA